jgi:glycosyltransferase involved in cell wall biosynthesis
MLVVSDHAIASRLDLARISHINLRGSLDPARSGGNKLINLLRYYLRLFVIVFQHRGQPIHFCGLLASRYIVFEGLILPVWLRVWAGRYIHTAHNVLPHGRENSRFFHFIYRWIYRFPHAVLAHTGKVADQLVSDYGVPRHRIEVISIGLNEEVPDPGFSQAEARRRLALEPERPLVLFFGKVEPYKGVDRLAEAWSLVTFPEAQLVITGWSPDQSYAALVRESLSRTALNRPVVWHDRFLSNEETALWLTACDVVVMPYRYIYQSGVVFLCLRFGVPIVATPVGSLAEYLSERNGIIAATNTPEGIASALNQFFATREQFDRAAIAQCAQKYRWDTQCAHIRHLYQ